MRSGTVITCGQLATLPGSVMERSAGHDDRCRPCSIRNMVILWVGLFFCFWTKLRRHKHQQGSRHPHLNADLPNHRAICSSCHCLLLPQNRKFVRPSISPTNAHISRVARPLLRTRYESLHGLGTYAQKAGVSDLSEKELGDLDGGVGVEGGVTGVSRSVGGETQPKFGRMRQRREWSEKSRAAVEFKRNGGVVLMPNFLSKEDHIALIAEASLLEKKAKPEHNSLAQGRLAAAVPSDSAISRAFASKTVAARLSEVVGKHLEPAGDIFPPELRVYRGGSHMQWHVDDVMFEEAQVEAVYTIENQGCDCETLWKIGKTQKIEGEVLPNNSLLLILAGGPEHCVTPASKGRRVIVKSVFCPSFQVRPEEFERLQRAAASS